MCQVLHQDSGCKDNPRAIAPRTVNASLLASKFLLYSGRQDSGSGSVQIDTSSPSIISEIQGFTELMFTGVTRAGVVETESRRYDYILEDICVITYKDSKGICYHYFDPELKTPGDDERPMTVASNVEKVSHGADTLYEDSTVSTTMRAMTSVFTTIMNVPDDDTDGLQPPPMSLHNNRVHYYSDYHATGKGGDAPSPSSTKKWYEMRDRDPVTLLTITSRFFPFLGRHTVKVFVPIIFQYQPLIEFEYVYAEILDGMIAKGSEAQKASQELMKKKTGPPEDTKNYKNVEGKVHGDVNEAKPAEIEANIAQYDEHVTSKLVKQSKDSIWLRYTPNIATIGFPPQDRGYQLAMMTEILNGKYLANSYFEPMTEDEPNANKTASVFLDDESEGTQKRERKRE